MPRANRAKKLTLHDLDHIPTFATEAEEAAFWDDHELGPDLLKHMETLPSGTLPPARPLTNAQEAGPSHAARSAH